MDAREVVELTVEDGWVHVALDPDDDGYSEMIIEKISDERDTMWSIDDTLENGAKIPYQARFDYDVYLKITLDGSLPKYQFAITRII